MTHALINALSKIAVDGDGNVIIGMVLKGVCIVIAVVLYYMVSRQQV